jgi:hypothetical protein
MPMLRVAYRMDSSMRKSLHTVPESPFYQMKSHKWIHLDLGFRYNLLKSWLPLGGSLSVEMYLEKLVDSGLSGELVSVRKIQFESM